MDRMVVQAGAAWVKTHDFAPENVPVRWNTFVVSQVREELVKMLGKTLSQIIHLLHICAFVFGTNVDSAVPSWEQYVRAPSSSLVRPVRVLSSLGNVTHASAILGTGVEYATLSRTAPPDFSQYTWPNGTYANASSYASPNVVNGRARTYYPSNAIDGDLTTFWNDNTTGVYPDNLTITLPVSMNLSAITLLSSDEGVPINFTVEVLVDGGWSTVGSVTGNDAVQIQVPFTMNVTTNAICIVVTLDQATPQGEYTRVTEVWPGLVPEQQQAPTIIVDFGQNVVGFPEISFAGASSNNPGVRVAFSETTEYLTDISDFTRSDNGDAITPGTDQFSVPDEPVTWVDTYGCLYGNGTQVCADGLHGFRYMKIYLDALEEDKPYAESYGEVKISSISLNFTAFLGIPSSFTGYFECSDTQLNSFWYDAAYTVEMCTDTVLPNYVDPRNSSSPSLIGKLVVFDGAKRDRDPYVGDLAVSARSIYLTHNVSIAARNVLADLAEHQNVSSGWIPPASINNYTLPLLDYPLYWVTCSYDLVVYTGDLEYAEAYYPVLLNVLNNFYPSITNTSTGLISKGLNGTAGYGDYAFLPRTGQVTYYNALYVAALKNAAQIARFLGGRDSDASEWDARAVAVTTAINQYLWDPSAGAYLDSSVGNVTHAQDGNAMAVLYGVANGSRAESVLEYFSRNDALPYGNAFFDNDALGAGFSQRVYAFISYFEISARFEAFGMADSALEEIKRLYGWMANHDPTITFWEGIGAGGSMYEGPYTSAAHGWSTGVIAASSNYVLGVIPTGPGFSNWRVKPIPGTITWARGQVPTPNGPLVVDWTMEGSQVYTFTLNMTAPIGTAGTVSVPVASYTDSVVVDGEPAIGAVYADGYTTVNMSSGTHVVSVKR